MIGVAGILFRECKIWLDTYQPKTGKAVKLFESHSFEAITRHKDDPPLEVLFMKFSL